MGKDLWDKNERNNIERIDIGVLRDLGVNCLYRLDIDC
ncbi:hypothetical protein yfred0001_39970 [Yersinia frederiksenii ATCC 33641]|nr:hypothetical protein yfred0001_39970 [Yersinia frederiksenii ATCC 33641]